MRTRPHVSCALVAALLLSTACGGTAGQSRSDSSQSSLPGEGSPQGDTSSSGEGGSNGGSTGGGGSSAPCASRQDCTTGEVCTTEDGVCNSPPGCDPGSVCPAVCYGSCRPGGERCGSTACAPGEVCCNPSCGICTPPDGACTQQICEPPPASACETDSDCRAFSDYCTGCDCRALSVCEPDPACPSPGVQCFADPCGGQEAYCDAGTCALRPALECPAGSCGPALGMPNTICPDGETVAGPGRCLRQPDRSCGWEIVRCPARAC